MRIRRLRLASDASRKRIAPQSTTRARLRFSRWIRMGMATAPRPLNMIQFRNVIWSFASSSYG